MSGVDKALIERINKALAELNEENVEDRTEESLQAQEELEQAFDAYKKISEKPIEPEV